MKISKLWLNIIFTLFMFIFGVGAVTIFLPQKTVYSVPSMVGNYEIIQYQFNVSSLTYQPNYIIGLFILSFLGLVGALIIYSNVKEDRFDSPKGNTGEE